MEFMMIKGIYTAVSAMIAGVNKQAIKAHNVANLNTPGFKQIFTTLQEFKQTEVIPNGIITNSDPAQSIGNLGLGVMTTETRTKFTNGSLQLTNHPFDLAIQGEGFFHIMTPQGDRYTRDGRFIRNANGGLITIDGNKVLDSFGKPIQLPDGELNVNSTGNLQVNGEQMAQLGIAEFSQPETQLNKVDGNIYSASVNPEQSTLNTVISQGYLEMSNVNVVEMMIGEKTYEAAQQMVQNQDELLGKSISTLGKLA